MMKQPDAICIGLFGLQAFEQDMSTGRYGRTKCVDAV